jgi:hypothetical protein
MIDCTGRPGAAGKAPATADHGAAWAALGLVPEDHGSIGRPVVG